jgi:outer membrane biosynthesis protein TonB
VALGGMLGGVGLMILLLPKPAKAPVQIVSVMVPAPMAPAAAPAASEEEGTTTIGPIELAATPTKGSGKGTKTASASNNSESSGSGPAAPLGTSLTGLNGLVGGPSGPSGGSSTGGGGGQLAAADVERVVQSHRAFVKRQCWDTALSTRSSGTPSSARVVVTVIVARDGSVQNVSASGGDTYPGLASCVQGNVKSWKFPPSEGGTVAVPFVFAAQ